MFASALVLFIATKTECQTMLCVVAGILFLIAAVTLHWTGDDDDEMYFNLFNADVSAIATPRAFAKILERIPVGSTILDIGVGSGTYLEYSEARALLKKRKLKVLGVDISAPNIAIC